MSTTTEKLTELLVLARGTMRAAEYEEVPISREELRMAGLLIALDNQIVGGSELPKRWQVRGT